MILGIGTDIIEISRFEAIKGNAAFLQKYYSANELQYFRDHNERVSALAGAFCVKEAVAKALGTGFVGFTPADIELLHNEAGKPYVKLYGAARALSDTLGIAAFHVSISHSALVACAFAVAEGNDMKQTFL